MIYIQTKAFNQAKGGNVVGACLQNVRLGYGIPAKYPNAITAWLHTQQHSDRSLPAGLDVPVFYTYGADGHINVRLANGQCWSDGILYASIDDYLAKHPKVGYLGWGESVDDVPVIKQGESTMTEDGVRYGYLAVTRKQPTADQLKYWIGRPSTEFTLALYKLSDSYPLAQPISVLVNGKPYVPK